MLNFAAQSWKNTVPMARVIKQRANSIEEEQMFERFTTLEEVFRYKLGTALSMEQDSLALQGELGRTAMRSSLTEIFEDHAQEKQRNIENLEQCFTLLGQEVSQNPSPATKGLAKELKSFMAKTDDTLVDEVVVAGALESQHHQVAVYESLLLQAKSLEATAVVELLSQNLLQEEAALEKLKSAADSLARTDALDRAGSMDGEQHGGSPDVEVPTYLPPGSI